MKTNILFLMLLLLFTGCETGEIYDKNETSKEPVLTDRTSNLVERDIDALVHDDEVVDEDSDALIVDSVPEKSYIEEDDEYVEEPKGETKSESVEVGNKLDVHKIRVGKHDGYTRLVLDIYENSQKATSVGSYHAQYYANRDEIVVTLNGYSKFSASLPSFPLNSVIKQIVFSDHKSENGYKFIIKLREEAKVRIFDLKNPARLAFDIKPLN